MLHSTAFRAIYLVAPLSLACASTERDFPSQDAGTGGTGGTSSGGAGATPGAGGSAGAMAGAGGDAGANTGGNAGMAGTGNMAGAAGSGTGGVAGGGGADACLGVICDEPPDNACESAETFRAYDAIGSCADGECSYTSNLISCACEDDACVTDPCAEVTCDSPPEPACPDASTLRTYAEAGSCANGSCSYEPTDTGCPFGCSAGACNSDPCAEVTCSTPPDPTCIDDETLRTYGEAGTCADGNCSYPPIDTACAAGCVDDACVSNLWLTLNTTNGPTYRTSHTAVWTGSELIVWGGGAGLPVVSLATGARYSPTRTPPDMWIPLPTSGAPASRYKHTAVWTGEEMIVWGGDVANQNGARLNTGGRYSISEGWSTMTTTGAPAARNEHTAVWTGTEMIVWGGTDEDSALNTGGRYNPENNSWTAVTSFDAPTARWEHTAVWTGTEMIIWGGRSNVSGNPVPLNTGSRYNPATNSWTPVTTTNAPSARFNHSAVWTGTEMIVWGGDGSTSLDERVLLGTGARYNPATNAWTTMATANAPGERSSHSAVWTGSTMIVWAGSEASGGTNTGSRYYPATHSWDLMSAASAPAGRTGHTATWIGSEMVVFGGSINAPGTATGGRYVP